MDEGQTTGCQCLSLEQIEKTIKVKMSEQFHERFNNLKDSVITLIAEKMSVLIEENHNLKRSLKYEVEDLRNWQIDINNEIAHMKVIESERESEKKQRTVIHELVKTFNSKLTAIEEDSKESIQGLQEYVQSINENVCEMLKEVPQVAVSSLEDRFSTIEEKLANASLTDVHSQYNTLSMMTARQISSESIESHDQFMIEVANEVDERHKRRKALVIHNIEETDNNVEDKIQVTNILKEIINDENLVQQQQLNIYRLGRRSPSRNRTVKVHLMSEEFCKRVLQHTGKLRDSQHYRHIVLQPDLTPTQRQHLKMLVEEKKQRNCSAVQCNEEPDWIIRRGKLCRRKDITTQ